MSKFYKFLLLGLSVIVFSVGYSQSKRESIKKSEFKNLKQSPHGKQMRLNELQCTLVDSIPAGESLTIIGSNSYGYAVGTNTYGDKEKANYYDLSTSGYSLLPAVLIYFGDARATDLTKEVTVRVYDGTSGKPGNSLGETKLTLKQISDSVEKQDPQNGVITYNEVEFSPVIALPVSKKVFISVDYSNLSIAAGEYLALWSTDFGMPTNLAWEKWSDLTWHSFAETTADNTTWNDSVIIAMFPIICNDVVTPVTLSSFSANRFGTANKLTWTTVSESSSKGFEVQRSADGVNFTTIAFVPSQATGGNSTATLNYSYADNAVLPNNNYYRIKQIDLTAKATFTKTLLLFTDKLKKEGIVQAYPNPVKNNLNLILDLGASKNNTLTVVDLAGRTLLQKSVQGSNGNQTTTLNVANLAKGTYFVKLTGEGNKKLVKFIKE